MYATALALLLLRTDPTADSGQGRGLLQHFRCREDVTTLNVLDERRDIDIHRTALHAGRLGTVQTALGFLHGHLLGQTDVHLLGTGGSTIDGIQFRHYHTFNLSAFLRLYRSPQFLAPFGITVSPPYGPRGTGPPYGPRGGFNSFVGMGYSVPLGGRQGGYMFLVVLHLLLLSLLERTHALEHLVPVHQRTVELRSVDAHKLRLAADGQTAGTTHARAVHHDSVQRHLAGDSVLLCRQVREFHHDGRTYGKHLVHMFLLNEFLNTYRHYSLLAIGTVVGHDDHLVRTLAYLILKYDQVLRAACHYAQHTVASLLQGLDNGQHRSHSEATAGTYHGTEFLDVRGIAQWAYHIRHVVAHVQLTQFR